MATWPLCLILVTPHLAAETLGMVDRARQLDELALHRSGALLADVQGFLPSVVRDNSG